MSRLVVLVPVAASVVMAVAIIVAATVDSATAISRIGTYFVGSGWSGDASTALLTDMVRAVDGYLLGTILLIFAFGLYELFVGKIGPAETSEFAGRLLLIRSIDDLKDRLAKVVVLVLVVKFFQQALKLTYSSVLDVLYLALGILLIGAAIYVSSGPGKQKGV